MGQEQAEGESPRVSRGALSSAVVLSVLLVFGSPVAGQLRDTVRASFPRSFTLIVLGAVAAIVVAAFVAAVARIRDRRAVRYLALVGALAIGVLYARALRTGNPEVDAVETFHFVEYGVVTLLFYLAWRPLEDGSAFVLPLAAGTLVGILDEWVQWFVPLRVGEMRDVGLDVIAVGCGLLFGVGLVPPETWSVSVRPREKWRIAVAVLAVTVAFGGFFESVHLGQEIQDQSRNTFLSTYSQDELQAADAERSQRWRADPPLVQRPLSREDHYLSEALWHVQRRNRAWTAEDWFTAWRENLILETHFAAAIDMPTYVSRAGLRWPPEQRVDAANRTARMVGPYESDAAPYGIYTWPPLLLWAGLLGAAGVGLAVFFSR